MIKRIFCHLFAVQTFADPFCNSQGKSGRRKMHEKMFLCYVVEPVWYTYTSKYIAVMYTISVFV